MKIYNARDCVALHQIRNGMYQYIEDSIKYMEEFKDTYKIIEKSMAEARAVIVMEQTGMLLDKHRYAKWKKDTREYCDNIENELRSKFNLPQVFSLKSSNMKKFWIYGEKISTINKKKLTEELNVYQKPVFQYTYACPICSGKRVKKYYPDLEEVPNELEFNCSNCKNIDIKVLKRSAKISDPDMSKEELKAIGSKLDINDYKRNFILTDDEPIQQPGKDTNTKTYKKLLDKVELANIEILPQLRGYKPLKTKSNNSALDKDALMRLRKAVFVRLDAIDNLTRRTPKHDEEYKGLERLCDAIELLQKYNKYTKLLDAFSKFSPKPDGRIYPQFLVTGTATGRLSSKKPNF